MVHLRINEREPNPNPYVNFITALPMNDPTVEEAARQLLRALAAQVKPIMKAYGFAVNSLEEYEYNRVFAGRNWNNGETIELVLRSSTGSLLSTHWLMSTLCHELAHIKHMDHGSAFQALWRQLQQEVRALQNREYYGDGYWSSGIRLADSAKMAGQGIAVGELPEYMCGGAHSRARPVSRRSRKPANLQTSKKRKAGSRVKSNAFNSIGKALNEDLEGESKSHGVGFRKKAGSGRAREERALAAEQRMQALQGKATSTSNLPISSAVEDEPESECEERDSETDYDRRRALLEVIEEKDLDALKATILDSTQAFLLPSVGSSGNCGDACDVEDPREPASGGFGQTKTSLDAETSTRPRKKRKTSQSKLIFTPYSTPAVTDSEAIKAKREDTWDCVVCTL
ncbi:WLM domain-containing protein [Boletus edulis BED1]|uniref:WLM domain-containing protein n=1 Tax=Boletus edulis BED1 TaxID=1328754 RepID=A0AAD4C6M6_BOLED|nr:WLM domain-containing protein [Boletus edulis BED1]